MNQLHVKGKWLEYTIDSSCLDITLEEVLKTKLMISGRRIQKLTRSNGLFINNKKSFLKKKVKLDDRIKLRIEEDISERISPVSMDLDIIYEDDWLLIINKAAGLKVYPTEKTDKFTLANGIQYYYKERKLQNGVHFVHRLDTNTSGAIMVAKNSYAHNLLAQQLNTNQIKRRYIAIVSGSLENSSGVIDAPIGKVNDTSNKRCISNAGERAVTTFVVTKSTPDVSMLEVYLETGKTHQIRVHFAHIGHPLLGDRLYGENFSKYIKRQALHSYDLSWVDLSNQETKTVRAAIPDDLAAVVNSIEHHEQE